MCLCLCLCLLASTSLSQVPAVQYALPEKLQETVPQKPWPSPRLGPSCQQEGSAWPRPEAMDCNTPQTMMVSPLTNINGGTF